MMVIFMTDSSPAISVLLNFSSELSTDLVFQLSYCLLFNLHFWYSISLVVKLLPGNLY